MNILRQSELNISYTVISNVIIIVHCNPKYTNLTEQQIVWNKWLSRMLMYQIKFNASFATQA